MDENTVIAGITPEDAAADAHDAAEEAAAEPVDLWGYLKGELSEEAHKVAQQLVGDLPALVQGLAGAAEHEAPVILKAVLGHPFMQHLEAQLPTATLGIVHGLLGLARFL